MTHPLIAAPMGAIRRLLMASLALALIFTAVACGGGGGGFLPSPVSVTDKRPLSAELTSRKAVAYSPYRSSRSEADLAGEVITPANVRQDLLLIRGAGIGTIRLFSSRAFAETVLREIRSNGIDLKVMLGAYVNTITGPEAEADNLAELARAVELANAYSDIVVAVSVGNETMVDWSTHPITPANMARYISLVRGQVKQPLTTDDNWYFWATAPKAVLDVLDFAALHTYAVLDTFYDPGLWDWRQSAVPADRRAAAMMEAALFETKRQYGAARDYLDRIGLQNMPIVIGETGWTAADPNGDPALPFRAHPVNQKMYYERLLAWQAEGTARGPKAIFYFQAFDEPWKGGDDGWGLFNENRQARCAVQGMNPPSATWVRDTSVSCDPSAALYYVPPVISEPLATDKTRYTLFTDAALAAGEARAPDQRWDAFGNPTGGVTASAPVVSTTAAPGDGSQSLEITPTPAGYGWGLLRYYSTPASANLSGFGGGSVRFWLRTKGYPGKIEIGIFTDTDDRAGAQAFVQIAPGDYGYCNSDAWCQVTIPVSAFVAANPKIDLRLVTTGFVIADRFEFTGKPQRTTGLPKLYVDGIEWVR